LIQVAEVALDSFAQASHHFQLWEWNRCKASQESSAAARKPCDAAAALIGLKFAMHSL